ncbi:MAG: hypothetical protein WCO44_05210 [Bacteroidota bacterium]
MRCSCFLSLLLAVLATACVPLKPPGLVRDKSLTTFRHPAPLFFDSSGRSLLFKATMDIKKHHLTGLLLIKPMGLHACRVVFASEIGITYFDLGISADSSRVISCFGPLNKKILTTIFISDFRILAGVDTLTTCKLYHQETTQHLVYSGRAGKFKIWQTCSNKGDTLLSQSAKSTLLDPVIISCQHYHQGFPAIIHLDNPVIGMTLSLKRLD